MGIMQINPRASQAPVLAQDILTCNALRRRGEPCCCIGCRRRRSKERHQRDGIQGGDVRKRVHEGAAPSAHNVNAPPSVWNAMQGRASAQDDRLILQFVDLIDQPREKGSSLRRPETANVLE